MKFVEMLRVVLVAFVALASSGVAVARDDSPAPDTSFASRVDLTPFGRIAVQGEGRVKSLGSHANSMMHFVSGPRKIADQDPLFTYIDLLLRPTAYADADIVYVKNRQVREQIASALEKGLNKVDPAIQERMDAFRATGLTSVTYLRSEVLGPLFRTLEADLIRSAKQMDQIQSALTVADPRFLLTKLQLIPPPSGSFDEQWHGIDEVMSVPGLDPALQSTINTSWRSLVNAWLAQDAPGVTAAATQLADALPKVAPGSNLYPEQSRLAWEYWYFQKDQLTSIWLIYMGLSLIHI